MSRDIRRLRVSDVTAFFIFYRLRGVLMVLERLSERFFGYL